MSGQTTLTSEALIRRDVYSGIILDELKDNFLPEGITRDLSDFPDGSVLFVTTFGEVVIKDLLEDQETPVDTIDTGRITMEITEHKGGGVYITDEVREDAHQMAQLDAAAPGKMLRGLKEAYETDMLSVGELNQTQNDPNVINGYAHRFVGSGPGGMMTLEDLAYVKTAFQVANIPDEALIGIVSPEFELYLNTRPNLVTFDSNPQVRGIVETGFAKNYRFIRNFFGIDLYVSNRLPRIATETIDVAAEGAVAPQGQTGPVTVTNAKAIQFMSMADESTMPYMSAWRRRPVLEADRNVPLRRDEIYMTTRYGFGLQRPQGLITVVSGSNPFA